jgi:hypothetical protein
MAGPFVLKYVDKDGTTVTMTSRNDVQAYLGELVVQYQRQAAAAAAHGPKLNNQLPPMKIQVVKVASQVRKSDELRFYQYALHA